MKWEDQGMCYSLFFSLIFSMALCFAKQGYCMGKRLFVETFLKHCMSV